MRAENFVPFAPRGVGAAAHVMSLLFFAFLGWEMIGHLAEEFKNPRRDIPISLGAAFAVVTAIYLAIAFVVVGSGVYRGGANTAMIDLIRLRWGEPAAAAVGVLGFVICYCPVHTYTAGFSRLFYAQAREGFFPKCFGELHPVHKTPYRALLCFVPLNLALLFASWALSWNLKPLMGIPSATFSSGLRDRDVRRRARAPDKDGQGLRPALGRALARSIRLLRPLHARAALRGALLRFEISRGI